MANNGQGRPNPFQNGIAARANLINVIKRNAWRNNEFRIEDMTPMREIKWENLKILMTQNFEDRWSTRLFKYIKRIDTLERVNFSIRRLGKLSPFYEAFVPAKYSIELYGNVKGANKGILVSFLALNDREDGGNRCYLYNDVFNNSRVMRRSALKKYVTNLVRSRTLFNLFGSAKLHNIPTDLNEYNAFAFLIRKKNFTFMPPTLSSGKQKAKAENALGALFKQRAESNRKKPSPRVQT